MPLYALGEVEPGIRRIGAEVTLGHNVHIEGDHPVRTYRELGRRYRTELRRTEA